MFFVWSDTNYQGLLIGNTIGVSQLLYIYAQVLFTQVLFYTISTFLCKTVPYKRSLMETISVFSLSLCLWYASVARNAFRTMLYRLDFEVFTPILKNRWVVWMLYAIN